MSRHIFSFDKHPLNKDKTVMADNGKSYLRIYGEGVIDRIHYDMLGKEIYMPLMDEIVIEEGVQLPVNSKYLFYTYDCRIVIYKNIDVSNIMDANCMFALTGNANPDTSLWELNPKCVVTDMFKNAKAYTGRDLEKEHEKHAPRFKVLNRVDRGIDKRMLNNFHLTVQEVNSELIFKVIVDEIHLGNKELLRSKLLKEFKIVEVIKHTKKEAVQVDLYNTII